YQKVMQLKRYREIIENSISTDDPECIAHTISKIKNDRMIQDYNRLGLKEDRNIYHYITRDKGKFVLQETAYNLIDLDNLRDFDITRSSFTWSDGHKKYRFTYADSQIWQQFSASDFDTTILEEVEIEIMDDPFQFLLEAYLDLSERYGKDTTEYE